MIWVLHSDIIPGDLASNIWNNNAYKISYIRKGRRAKITEMRRNVDWMTLKGHWMVSEMYLPFSRLNGDWKVIEWRLSVFTEWLRFVLCINVNIDKIYTDEYNWTHPCLYCICGTCIDIKHVKLAILKYSENTNKTLITQCLLWWTSQTVHNHRDKN